MIKENLKDMIYEVRGKQVMLDSDLARLYECKNGTKEINQVVKRNIGKFSEEFCFQLNENDSKVFWSQIVTKKTKYIEKRGGKYNKPYVFTEYGVIMLSSVLRSSVANEINKKVIKAFVDTRKYILRNVNLYKEIIDFKQDIKSKLIHFMIGL